MIAQAHIVAMQRVDQIKVSPHEPIAAVYGIEAAPGDAAPGVELAPCRQKILLKRVRRHPARLKWNSIVAVAVVEPPMIVEQPPLALQTVIERCARERCEMVECGNVKRVFLRKRDRGAEAFGSVPIVT